VDPVLVNLAHAVVETALGRSGAISRVDLLQVTGGTVALRMRLTDSRRLVLKVAQESNESVDFERTRAATARARAAGVPTPAVLAADNSGRAGRRYLLLEHLDGVPWRQVRPQLEPSQVAAAHEELARAVLTLQSISFGSCGEFDRQGQLVGRSLLDALRQRAELRVVDPRARDSFHRLLDRAADLFRGPESSTLCHDDLHHGNVLFRDRRGRWELAGLLDWDKAWAGPAESDLARMAFWDDMTGPDFWRVYRAAVPTTEGQRERSLIYQLLWCLEYDDGSPRHAADRAALERRLRVP
jgi:aminoglycoside phosphotransferase (APT) family kinase protein